MQNDKHPPPLDPGLNKSQPYREDQPVQSEERLWKHESEIPDASTSKDKTHTPSGSTDNPRKENEPKKPQFETAKEDQNPEKEQELRKHGSETPDATRKGKDNTEVGKE